MSAAWRGGEAQSAAHVMTLPQPTAGTERLGVRVRTPSLAAESEPGDAIRQALDQPNRILRWWTYSRELMRRFNRDQCPVFAASLSFFGLVSLVPVLLVAIAALGFLIHDPVQARHEILKAIDHLLPGAAARVAAKVVRRGPGRRRARRLARRGAKPARRAPARRVERVARRAAKRARRARFRRVAQVAWRAARAASHGQDRRRAHRPAPHAATGRRASATPSSGETIQEKGARTAPAA